LNQVEFSGKRVLFVGAHPDDIELGCGALISNIVGRTKVICVTLSDNRNNSELKNLVGEHRLSMDVLGVPKNAVVIETFETRNFARDRQQILEYLYQLNRDHKPELVFVHSSSDIHQDHGVVTQEALRAFRGTSLLGFDVLRSSHGFFPDFLVEVTEADVERKLKALACYETYKDRYYFDPEIIRSTLIRHGALAERPFAEGFDILRIVGSFGGPAQ
jgi:LmbE family N-acetylglucosaminyl deacetylase